MTLEHALEFHKEGKLQEAKSIYESLLLIDDDPRILYYLGLVELQIGRVQHAIDAFQKSVLKNPNIPVFHVALGKALLQAGQLNVAEVHFFQAVKMEPCGDNFFLLGTVQVQLEDMESAQHCWEMGLQYDPNHLETLVFLGSLMDEQNEEQQSLGYWERAHKIDPHNPRVIEVLSRWHSRKAEELKEVSLFQAKVHIEQAIAYQPLANLYHQQALILLELGEVELAETSCKIAIQAKEQGQYFFTLGRIHMEGKQYFQALVAFQKAKELGLEHPSLESIDSLSEGELSKNPEVFQQPIAEIKRDDSEQ